MRVVLPEPAAGGDDVAVAPDGEGEEFEGHGCDGFVFEEELGGVGGLYRRRTNGIRQGV